MATSKFKRFGIPAALVVGGVTAGSLFAPLGLASAQDGDDADNGSTDESESTEERGHRHGRRGHRGFKAEAVTEALGLSREEIRAGFEDGKTLAEMAEEQGISADALSSALVASITEAVEQAVADGKIDADKAQERLAEVEANIDEFINKDPADFERGQRMGRHGHHRFGKLGAATEEVEELLGLSGEEIRAAMAEGASLADIAEQQGVSVEELSALLVAGIEDRIDEAVESGKLDPDRAGEIKDGLDEMIERSINAEFDGSRGFGRHHHHPHSHGADADSEPSVEESSI
ncbi:MAG: hypothetical protein ACR2QK_24340 [Acidimicrobiales bacterium]